MKTKKRLLSILLSFVMVLELMPSMSLTAYADDPYASLKNTINVITFDGKSWYLIDYDYDDSTVTLLAKECVGASTFGSNNTYSGSTVETFVNNWYMNNNNISADAKAAVSGSGMYLLTTEQATTIKNANKDVLKCNMADGTSYNYWWLCSQGNNDCAAVVYGGFADVSASGYNVGNTYGVRPALKLNLSKVTFDPDSNTFSIPVGYSVTIAGGANATVSGGEVNQTEVTGEMKTVTYTAKSGYKFPESSDYFKTTNGITVARTSDTVVTVSGTPEADTEITVPDAEEVPVHRHDIQLVKEKEPTYTENGYKEHYECTECGKWFADISGSIEYSDEERQKLIIPKLERQDESNSSSDNDSSSDSDSGSSGGGSRGKSGSISQKSIDVNGITVQTQPDSGAPLSDRGGNWGNQEHIWTYTKSDGSLAKGEWLNLEYDGHTYWYYFDDNTIMQTNWFDYNGSRYFLVPEMDGWRGRMATGWHMVDNKWYYFEPTIGANQGILYRGMTTPDGHTVGADGAWDGNGTTPVGAIHTGTTVTMN